MVEIYDAHEQGEIVKKWLKENGGAIVMGLVIAFGGLFGFKQWQAWQVTSRQAASMEFEALTQLLTENQLDAAMANYQNLQDDHAKSPYATMAALAMAKGRISVNQPDLAIGLYQQVIDNAYPAALGMIARERLARVLLSQGRADEALATLDAAGELYGFESRFAEVRGDIHFEQGHYDEAVAAYTEAMVTLEERAGDRGRLTLKLEQLGAPVPGEGGES